MTWRAGASAGAGHNGEYKCKENVTGLPGYPEAPICPRPTLFAGISQKFASYRDSMRTSIFLTRQERTIRVDQHMTVTNVEEILRHCGCPQLGCAENFSRSPQYAQFISFD